MRRFSVVVAGALPALFACNSTPPLPDCSAALPAGAIAVRDPAGAVVCVEPGVAPPTLSAAGDLAVTGYTPVGKAYQVTQTGAAQHGVDVVLPVPADKVTGGLDHQLVILLKRGAAPAHAAMVSNVFVEVERAKVHFHLAEALAGTVVFQAALPANAGQTRTRHYTFRGLSGVSMGGFGASVNFWRHPDRFDAIAVLGADPGPDMTYSLGMVADYFTGGFCTAQDGVNRIGQLCPSTRAPLVAQGERAQSFEAMLYESGTGTGLTLKRDLYMRAIRDLSRAMGNVATYNLTSPYLPPGVPASRLTEPAASVCANPTRLKKFYDWRYNPTAQFDVITFCDGNDSDAVGLGKFDPATPATNPPQVLLAVDVNGNGKRDSGEPVITQHEPYDDVGVDGLADKDEPGYDPIANPDPSGDNFHYLWNPTGTEGNWRYDQGEPFRDYGVDGVPMSVGGCPQGSGTDCWDFGEGNGKFDYTPTQDNWRALDPRSNVEKLDAAALSRIDVYYDAGIRDFFNAQVSTNSLLGVLTATGRPVRAYDGFPALVNLAPSKEAQVDMSKIDMQQFGRNVYIRYGDPDLPQATVELTGDGRHAGAVAQVVKRAQALFYWLSSRWPNGDRAIAPVDSTRSKISGTLLQANGRMTPYSLTLPPGYFSPENASKTYPVLYIGHGYGMDPDSISMISGIATGLMVSDVIAEDKRLQKFMIVAIDAACRPGGNVQNDQFPTGDLCEEGGFYVDHPEGTYLGETMLEELEAELASKYRVRPAADVVVSD